MVSGAERVAVQSAVESPDLAASANSRSPADPLTELRSRVEALERSVFSNSSELGEEEQPSVAEAR